MGKRSKALPLGSKDPVRIPARGVGRALDEPRASHCHCPLVMSGSGEQKEEDDGKGGEKHRRRKQNERMR